MLVLVFALALLVRVRVGGGYEGELEGCSWGGLGFGVRISGMVMVRG